MSQLLDAAIEYASKGMAVFPVKPREKIPLTKNGVKDATTNFDQIEKWWRRHPTANIGIACGAPSGGLVVVDLDEKDNGVSGSDSLNEWERQNGFLPDSVRSLTGSGGVHILYRLNGTTKNRVNLLDGVDIRADGGYIVAPPSIHPNGNRYEWEYGPEDTDIAEADDIVKKLLDYGKESEPDKFVMPDKIGKGQRNDTIYKLACSLQAKGLPDSVILTACSASNLEQCNPPLSDEEVGKIVESALKHDKGSAKKLQPISDIDLITITDSKGHQRIRQCAENVARVILNDPNIAGKIKEDTFGHRLIYFGQLKWRRPGDTMGEWSDKDDAALESYLDIQYGLRNKNDYLNGFNMALLENEYNPLVGFLDALKWDGKPRIDEAMNVMLGVERNDYNEMVFRVFLQSMIRRAYEPGSDFNLMPVLHGPQGCGKTTFFRLLACNNEWYDDNFNFKDADSKTLVERMTGKWILEMGEMDTMKKDTVTSDALKAFITGKMDRYRMPYSRRGEDRKRQCVFCGTTNDANFLKDRTGNRRYAPIDCHPTDETKARIFDFKTSRPYFEQIVAEAVAYYKTYPDELPDLPQYVKDAADQARIDHLEEDPWVGIIQEYLDNEVCSRVNATYLYERCLNGIAKNARKGEIGRILTIMRNDVVGWKEIGRAELMGYGKGICFERVR